MEAGLVLLYTDFGPNPTKTQFLILRCGEEILQSEVGVTWSRIPPTSLPSPPPNNDPR